MNARRPLLPLACLVASLLVLSACFGSSSPPPPPVAIAFIIAPPTSVNVGGNFPVEAAVANTSNTEVNWSCTPTGACGTFASTQTASGAQTTYMAPATVPANGSVTILATSAADSSKFASGNVTISPGGAITVSFSPPAPPPTLTISGGGGTSVAQVSATITSTVAAAVNDGVSWTATCSVAGGCGSFSSNQTGSGISTTYTAPNSVPAGGLAVTVKAASTFDPTVSVSGVINVSTTTPAAFLCAGCSYTFTASGQDLIETTSGAEPSPYAIAGQFTVDGAGNVTGGEQDYADLLVSTYNAQDTIMSGSYSFTPDGRGTITLNSVDRGAETLGVVLVSPNHMLVTEFDTLATGSGSMDLQTNAEATLSGGYAFVSGGSSLPANTSVPVGFGGVFNVTSAGTISGTGSTCDDNYGGNISTQQGLTGSFATPDTYGRVQITLHPDFIGAQNLHGPVILAAYTNDVTHLKFVEVDSNFAVSSGIAVGQGATTGSFTSAAKALPSNSSYVFTAFGASVMGPYNFVTALTSDGSSKLQDPNGASSPNSDVNNSGVPSTGSITGTFTVDTSGTGRVAASLQGVPLASVTGNGTTATKFAIYLTGGSDPAMTLELDNVGITTGSAYTQTTSTFSLSSISGPYGLNYTYFGYDVEDETYDIEFDATGQLLADSQGNLLGLQDINVSFAPSQGQASSGSYAQNGTSRFTGTLSSTTTGPLQFSYYVVSPTQVVIIETDITAVTLGVLQLQTPPF